MLSSKNLELSSAQFLDLELSSAQSLNLELSSAQFKNIDGFALPRALECSEGIIIIFIIIFLLSFLVARKCGNLWRN